jgi:3-oxoacyl-[acyl-carrier protein] reductase
VALVTGGSRGIGAAIARALADQGADVALSYAASADEAEAVAKELQENGVHAKAFKPDQADAKQVENLVNTVAKEFGQLDILVNNAGVFVLGAVNDLGVAAAVQAPVPYLKEGGRIISIGSVVGEATPFAGAADYSATKAALLGYTRGWARDLGAKGITVNNVQPGPIETDMNPLNGNFADMQKSRTALGRYGRPEEVAAVAFLASPAAALSPARL